METYNNKEIFALTVSDIIQLSGNEIACTKKHCGSDIQYTVTNLLVLLRNESTPYKQHNCNGCTT